MLEITTPYDNEESCDIHNSYESLFQKLATMVGEGFQQTEIQVVRWGSWEDRESQRNAPEFQSASNVVLDVDRLLGD